MAVYWYIVVLEVCVFCEMCSHGTPNSMHNALHFHPTQLGGKSRKVLHLQFTSWPDHGVPEYAGPSLTYLRRVKAETKGAKGPAIFHCRPVPSPCYNYTLVCPRCLVMFKVMYVCVFVSSKTHRYKCRKYRTRVCVCNSLRSCLFCAKTLF